MIAEPDDDRFKLAFAGCRNCALQRTRHATSPSIVANHDDLWFVGKRLTKSVGEVHSPAVHHLRCSIIGPELRGHRSLLDWFRGHLVAEGMIDPGDVDLVQLIDDPQQAVDAIFAFYEQRGFELSPAEREVLLNL